MTTTSASHADRKPTLVKPSDHTSIGFLGVTIVALADHATTGGHEIFFMDGVEGSGPKPHAHDWDEAYYLIDGEIELVLAGQAPWKVSAGEFAFVPAGTVHGFRVTTPRARFLSINSGRGAAEFFGDVSREIGEQMNVPKFLELARRHEVKMAPPPAAR
jgi:mannose-6-phosphate isomerase-like protein (cupin superfamily)